MRTEAKPGVIVAVVATLVIVVGLLAWRTFGNQAKVADLQTIKATQAKKATD